jgi:integrase
VKVAKITGGLIKSSRPINYLSQQEVNRLTNSFQNWFDASRGDRERRRRGRYWLTYLLLRFTGARLSEVLSINDDVDIDYRNSEVRLLNLKRHNPKNKGQYRQVPVPAQVVSEIARYLMEFPEQRGKVFKVDASNFRKCFLARCKEVGIARELSHPHVLRHTRAIELLKAGVPVTAVQQLLGHAYLSTTAVYLQLSGSEIKDILKEKGLI